MDLQRRIRDQAYAVVEVFHGMRVVLDFTPASMMAIEAYMLANTERGMARPGSLFVHGIEPAIFAFGCYTGEVLRRARHGEWLVEGRADEEIALDLGGSECWPVQRVTKRFHLGAEENLQHYVAELLRTTAPTGKRGRGAGRSEPGPQPTDETLVAALAADRHPGVPAFAPTPGMHVTRPPTDPEELVRRHRAAIAAEPALAPAGAGPGSGFIDATFAVPDPRSVAEAPAPAPDTAGITFIEDEDDEAHEQTAPAAGSSRIDPFADRELAVSTGAGGVPPQRAVPAEGVTFTGQLARAWAIAGPLIALTLSSVWRANAYDWFDGEVTPVAILVNDALAWLMLAAALGYPVLFVLALRGQADLGWVGRVVLLLLSLPCWIVAYFRFLG